MDEQQAAVQQQNNDEQEEVAAQQENNDEQEEAAGDNVNPQTPQPIWRPADWSVFSPWILTRSPPKFKGVQIFLSLSSILSGLAFVRIGWYEYCSLGQTDRLFYICLTKFLFFLSTVVLFYALIRCPQIQFRYSPLSIIFRSIVAMSEVWLCATILLSIKTPSVWLCWLYVAASAYATFATRILFPTFDFLIPTLLAQIGMNASLAHELNEAGSLFRWGIFGACYVSFVIRKGMEQGIHLFVDRFVALVPPENNDNDGIEPVRVWRRPSWWIFRWILMRDPGPRSLMGYSFLVASFLSGLFLSYSAWYEFRAFFDYNIILYVVFVIPLLFFITTALFLSLDSLPHFQFRYPILSVFVRPLWEACEVFVVAQILFRIGRHTPALCWFYTAASGYAMYAMRILFPTYDFLVPTALSEVAMNDALNNDVPGFEVLVFMASFVIYVIMEGIDRRAWTNWNVDRLAILAHDHDA